MGEIEKKYLAEAIDSGFVSSVGPCIAEFEKKMAGYLNVPAATALQNGTAAIHMALYESGIGPGDEVIVPALTFAATVNPVLYVGATPVIVDVDPSTWTIDPAGIKQAVTPRTKAIIPVHLYGNPCHMTEIMDIASKYRLCVIEDATESLGAMVDGRHTGSFGVFGCFSFNGNKLITTGGGGMIVGSDPQKIAHIQYLINQAKDPGMPGQHSEMGFNLRMTNIEAALGLAQFERMGGFLRKKKAFQEIYRRSLGEVAGIVFQQPYGGAAPSGWLTCIKVAGKKDLCGLMETLNKRNVPTRRVFMPAHEMPYLKRFSRGCPNASDIYDRSLCLPGSTLNEEKDIQYAAAVVREVLQ